MHLKLLLVLTFIYNINCTNKTSSGDKFFVTPKINQNKHQLYLILDKQEFTITKNHKILAPIKNCEFYLGDHEGTNKVISLSKCQEKFYGVLELQKVFYDLKPEGEINHVLEENRKFTDQNLFGKGPSYAKNLTGDILDVEVNQKYSSYRGKYLVNQNLKL